MSIAATITFSGEDYGEMLRGEACNRVFIPLGFCVNKSRLEYSGVIAHIHAPINHMGYSSKNDAQFLIINLN